MQPQEIIQGSSSHSGQHFSRAARILQQGQKVLSACYYLESALLLWILFVMTSGITFTNIILFTNFYFLRTYDKTGLVKIYKINSILTVLISSEMPNQVKVGFLMYQFFDFVSSLKNKEMNSYIYVAVYNLFKYLIKIVLKVKLPGNAETVLNILLIFLSYNVHEARKEDKFLAGAIFFTLKCVFAGEFSDLSTATIFFISCAWIIHKHVYSQNRSVEDSRTMRKVTSKL